jgi:hypothetical protein
MKGEERKDRWDAGGDLLVVEALPEGDDRLGHRPGAGICLLSIWIGGLAG